MRDISARVKKLETAIHSKWKSYSVTYESDISKITTNEGLILLDAPELIGQIDKRLEEINAIGKYVIIINDVPKAE